MENESFEGPSAELANMGEKYFGARIRDLRKERGYSQEALAQGLSMTGRSFSQSTVAKIENGTRPTSVGELHLLAALLDVEITDFFMSEEDAAVYRHLSAQASKCARLAQELEELANREVQVRAEFELATKRYEDMLNGLSPADRMTLEGKHGKHQETP
ncbi:helix-turn-helix transcriptional regulator [Kocuria sp. CPCC 205231]|uniref:helix-turn-helix domain-containing protein n=1 Tax=Kocuria sp. CPCC 205231 TaxID=3073551 RepID=UPI0034D440F3